MSYDRWEQERERDTERPFRLFTWHGQSKHVWPSTKRALARCHPEADCTTGQKPPLPPPSPSPFSPPPPSPPPSLSNQRITVLDFRIGRQQRSEHVSEELEEPKQVTSEQESQKDSTMDFFFFRKPFWNTYECKMDKKNVKEDEMYDLNLVL